MPTPDRTSLEEIIGAGRGILAADGLAGLTMQAVAARVGVRPPSLYKRVTNREALIGLIAARAAAELTARIEGRLDADATASGAAATGAAQLGELARAFREFAHSRPAEYRLLFAGTDITGTNEAVLARASEPVLRVAEALAGKDRALDAARTITAWANGFLAMELSGAFQLGGDVDRAFDFGIRTLATALEAGRA